LFSILYIHNNTFQRFRKRKIEKRKRKEQPNGKKKKKKKGGKEEVREGERKSC
jgi:hypothetical protein